MKRSVLQLILQGCNNDMVQAIEQVLSNHSPEESVSSVMGTASSLIPTIGSTAMSSSAFKSAFSPISSIPNAHSLSAMRYAWGGIGARGLLSMPMPPTLPGLAMSSAYAGYPGALTSGTEPKPFHYAMYPCCTTKPFSSSSTDKTGCIGD